MVKLIRRFQKPILVLVVIVVIISFVVFLNLPGAKYGGTRDVVATAYGRNISHTQMGKEVKRFELCTRVGLGELLMSLCGREALYQAMMTQQMSGEALQNFVWNSVVLRHEADALGIQATEEEVEKAIKTIPAFQTNGAFDYGKFGEFQQRMLSPNGLTPTDFEELLGEQVRLQKVRALIGTTVQAAPGEVRQQYVEQNQKTEASFFRLKLEEFKNAVTVTEEELAKAFAERKETLKTPEKRKVKFVGFTMAAEQKPLVGRPRALATQRLAEQARDFSVAMTEKGATFESVAEKMKVAVAETPLFTTDDPPAELAKSEEAAEAAFKLTPEQPNSDVVTSADGGYFVLQLAGSEPSRPLSAEEAKPQLTELLKQERGQEAMTLKATELRTKIEAEVKGGKPFEEAVKIAGVTVEKIPAFSAADQQQRPAAGQEDTSEIKARAAGLAEGALSEFIPSPTGGVIVHVDKRLPIDEAAFEKEKGQVAQMVERQRQEAVFADWLRERRAAANIQDSGRS